MADSDESDVDFLAGAPQPQALPASLVALPPSPSRVDRLVAAEEASDSDVDFLNCGQTQVVAESGVPSQQLVAVPPTSTELVVPGHASSVYGSGPRKRTLGQHALLAARMRECKARKRYESAESSMPQMISTAIDALQGSALVRKGRLVRMGTMVRRRQKLKPMSFAIVVRGQRDQNQGRTVRVRLATPAILDICFDEVAGAAHIAKTFRISDTTVRRIQRCGAHVVLQRQGAKLSALVSAARTTRPRFVVSNISFDETSERLKLKVAGSNGGACSSWQVLVSRQSFTLGVPFDGRLRVGQLDLIRPCIPLISTGAPPLYYGLFQHSAVAGISDAEAQLVEAVETAIVHHDCDGAASNLKMLAVRLARLPASTLASVMHCGNHRNQLVEVAVTQVVGLALFSSLYSMALFLRMGAHWVRLIHAVPRLVAQRLRVRIGTPPPSRFGAEVPQAARQMLQMLT